MNAGALTGTSSFVLTANQVNGGVGGRGGVGSEGRGGNGALGGNGGNAFGGAGGNGLGCGINNLPSGVFTISPGLGAKKHSKQSNATNVITANQANAGLGGTGGAPGIALAGAGGSPGGMAGNVFPGSSGTAGSAGLGIGGGLDLVAGGMVVIDNTTISGNHATTTDNDVFSTFAP
jgi:hypothetical protein